MRCWTLRSYRLPVEMLYRRRNLRDTSRIFIVLISLEKTVQPPQSGLELPQDPQKLCPCNLKRFLNGCASHPGQMDDIYL